MLRPFLLPGPLSRTSAQLCQCDDKTAGSYVTTLIVLRVLRVLLYCLKFYYMFVNIVIVFKFYYILYLIVYLI